MKEKMLVSLDGAVESLVTAWLLKKQGYQLRGVMFDISEGSENQSLYTEKVAEIEKRLGITVQVVHCGEEARAIVNREVQFGIARGYRYDIKSIFHQKYLFPKLLELKNQHQFQKVATGHRVSVHHEPESKRVKIFRYPVANRDESHLLVGLSQEQLSSFEFPLGSIPLSMIQKLATELNLTENLRPAKFELHHNAPEAHEGAVYSTDGSYVGMAEDMAKMSVGEMLRNDESRNDQRVVFEMDPTTHAVLVGSLEDHVIHEVWLENASWFSGEDLKFKLKSCMMTWGNAVQPVPVTLMQYEAGGMKAMLAQEIRGENANLFPGDSVLWTEGEEVLGGARVVKCL